VQFREVAREQVKGSLLLDAVADLEKIEVTDADIARQIGEIAAGTKQDPASVANLYQTNQRAKENLIVQLREDKAVQYLLDHAKVTEVAKEEIQH
jgi:trigger factor